MGATNYKLIDGTNPLGQDWNDIENLDDFHPSEIVLPVGKKVRVRITARDVLHNFYLPHFRVKMDAVPGMPTYFVFTPTKTTDEFRQQLKAFPEYQGPADETDPEGPRMWEAFDYELACAELCGRSHYAMRLPVKVVSEGEFNEWASNQPSFYASTIQGTDNDPLKDEAVEEEDHSEETETEGEESGE